MRTRSSRRWWWPNNPPTNVDWAISGPDSNPKIIDVIAGGTSFRLTQRSDFASFLARNSVGMPAYCETGRQISGEHLG